MSERFLRDVTITGGQQVLESCPGFDFYRLSRVLSLSLVPRGGEGEVYDLTMSAAYEDGRESYVVTLLFGRLVKATLPELTPTFYVAELEIEDVSRDQMEGIRFRVVDHCMSALDVFCGELSISMARAPDE